MPELPEVETTIRALRPFLNGRIIIAAHNNWANHIATPSLPELQRRIQGLSIQSLSRRGKYILIHLAKNETLIIHLRMSGHLSVVDTQNPHHKHDHTFFTLDNRKELRFRDQRKFGKVYLVQNPAEILGKLGPEPLATSFTQESFAMQFKGRRKAIKTLLLDQRFIAGVGNIYADEALFIAGIHPQRGADSLNEQEIYTLFTAIQQVLRLGLKREGASISDYRKPDGTLGDMQNAFAVFRRTGSLCYKCDTLIERIKLGGRGTHFCPHCQQYTI